MATIIDKLIVTLGLDSRDFKKGQRETETDLERTRQGSAKTRKQWESDAKVAVEGFRKIRNEILGMGLAYVGLGAIKSFTSNLLSQDIATQYLAKGLGMATEELNRWEQAAERMGSSTTDIDSAFRNVRHVAESYSLGTMSPDLTKAFAFGGVDMAKMFDRSLKPQERMLELSRALAKMEATRAYELGNLMGLSEQSINMLRQGPAAVEKMLASVPGGLSDSAAEAEKRLLVQIENIKDRFRNLGRELLGILGPVLLQLGDDFSKWITAPGRIKAITDEVKELVSGFRSAVPLIKDAASELNSFVSATMGWVEAIKLFAAWKLGGAVGVAAVAGWDVGKWTNKQIEEQDKSKPYGTGAGEQVGAHVAALMAMFGSEDAKMALGANSPKNDAAMKKAITDDLSNLYQSVRASLLRQNADAHADLVHATAGGATTTIGQQVFNIYGATDPKATADAVAARLSNTTQANTSQR